MCQRFGSATFPFHSRYNKTEDLLASDMSHFTHLMIGVSHESMPELEPYRTTHRVIHIEESFDRVVTNWRTFPFPSIAIKMKPSIAILEKIQL